MDRVRASARIAVIASAVAPFGAGAVEKPKSCIRYELAPPGIKGAYYHKLESEPDRDAHGIHGVAVLPQVHFDPTRNKKERPYGLDPKGYKAIVSMDTPSVYLGGNAGTEADVGLTWDRVYDSPSGAPVYTDAKEGTSGGAPAKEIRVVAGPKPGTKRIQRGDGTILWEGAAAEVGPEMNRLGIVPNMAFRPYWRDQKPECRADPTKCWHNPKLTETAEGKRNLYVYPGQKVDMTVEEVLEQPDNPKTPGRFKPGRLRLTVVGPNGERFQTEFDAAKFGEGRPTNWKRVNSIDLANNERKEVAKTATTATGGGWKSVHLLTGPTGNRPVPFTCGTIVKGNDAAFKNGGYHKVFHVSPIQAFGAVTVDIHPAGPPAVPALPGAASQAGTNAGRTQATVPTAPAGGGGGAIGAGVRR